METLLERLAAQARLIVALEIPSFSALTVSQLML
jgi:hypothetical protein